MNKNSILVLLVSSLALVFACDDQELKYSSHDNIYFDYSQEDGDSTRAYTFAYNPGKSEDTVNILVSVSGNRVSYDRKFKVEVEPKYTTASVDTHYKALDEYYILPADSGSAYVPLIVYNKDQFLETSQVKLILRLASTDDLLADIPQYSTSTVTISNMLEEPDWWAFWKGSLGEYTRTKHALYLIAVGNIDLVSSSSEFLLIPYNLYVIDNFRQFLADPFSWTDTNDKNYVLQPRSDGNYDFYTTDNPYKVYLLKLNPDDGKYYFIDENKERVIVY